MSMTQHNDRIETEVRETLELLDTLPRLEADHLFRARVLQRISNDTDLSAGRANVPVRGMKLAFMALLLFVNVGSGLVLMLSEKTEQTLVGRQETIESLVYEYSNPALSYYLENNSLTDTDE